MTTELRFRHKSTRVKISFALSDREIHTLFTDSIENQKLPISILDRTDSLTERDILARFDSNKWRCRTKGLLDELLGGGTSCFSSAPNSTLREDIGSFRECIRSRRFTTREPLTAPLKCTIQIYIYMYGCVYVCVHKAGMKGVTRLMFHFVNRSRPSTQNARHRRFSRLFQRPRASLKGMIGPKLQASFARRGVNIFLYDISSPARRLNCTLNI